MHKKFTFQVKRSIAVAALVLLNFISPVTDSFAQVKWSGVYGNEWLAGKYGPNWIKISVSQKGIHKVTLPSNFQNKPGQLHLYHRGVEVALTSATNTEIQFYGVPNDGASDALFYRDKNHNVDPSQRTNDKYSMFSDVSAYFLTYFSSTDVERAVLLNDPITAIESEKYHLQTELKLFTDEYSYSIDKNFFTQSLQQSYLENAKGMTSTTYGRHATLTNPLLLSDPTLLFPVKNLYASTEANAEVEVLLYSRTPTSNDVSIQAGKDAGSLRSLGSSMTFAGFASIKRQYTLNVSDQPANSDVPVNGNLNVKLVTNKVTSDYNTVGIYSMTYVQVKYPQQINMSGQTSALLNLPAKSSGITMSKVTVTNAPASAKVFDVTNPDKPIELTASYAGSDLNVMIRRQANQPVTLLVSSAAATDATSSIATPVMVDYDPQGYNYLIVTTNNLKAAAEEYKTYRASAAGGSYSPLVIDIADVYNQFNYGEPSPVAIRRFVDFMISKGIRSTHNLLLVGHSITEGDQTQTNKELPNQVPSIGFPGSDVLLVEGLGGVAKDVPAIPVGRITATTVEQVRNYLEKVNSYEHSTENLTYRKRSMHINGGVNNGESDRFGAYYTNTLNTKVTAAPFSGNVITQKKPNNLLGSPEPLDITQDVNSGLGFMSYFGHGNPHYTDYNLGYISDSRKGYTANDKYPVMYFNGCGVGNIFKGSTTSYPSGYTGSDKNLAKEIMPMTADWMLSKRAGAIAIIGNSFYAFESSSRDYLFALYDQIFPKSENERPNIGKIHQSTASYIITVKSNNAPDDYTLANTHQSLLQGDPALRILSTSATPFPVELFGFKGKYASEKVRLDWNTAWEINNRKFIIERSYNAKNFEEIGSVEGKGDSNQENAYKFFDASPSKGTNYYRLKQVDFMTTGSDVEKATYSNIISVNVSKEGAISVYPNPTNDLVNVEMDIPASLQSWELIDVNGRTLSRGTSSNEISLKNLPQGEYILKMNTSNGDVYSKKLLKN
ncbi:Por secretion system C-terminal sorting domain-containing protein [Dyadobacter koreensis]|uniref:Por secretion system C-terminal sorting domain-containing protein n=1 Tax=Dyadobacter koreensis TaxID=408657 RepID=A0A1H6R9K4_9BACT|nr:C25 family cysteine peptidase [Dyadobacter koreensis]SEI51156.1 Por secretion system C-terminal sorting domain-containing protein [Dyadobacter koreensis]